MKNKGSQPRDDERLIKTLNQFGKMYNDMKPGLAERIKQQIPENLGGKRESIRSFRSAMNLRIGKLVAATVIIGEVILLLCVFGGEELSDGIYMQGKYLTRYFEPQVQQNWNRFVNNMDNYSCPNEPAGRIYRGRAIVQEKMTPEQQQPVTAQAGDKETESIDTKGLIATAKPPKNDQKAGWSDILNARSKQKSTRETARRNAEAAVDTLGSFAELTGTYPNELLIMAVMREFREAYNEKQAGKATSKDQRYRQLADTTKKLKWLCGFYEELYKNGNDPAYYGHRLESRNADGVLMRWRLATGEYMVIFGDLRTKIVTPEELELLEKFENNGSHL